MTSPNSSEATMSRAERLDGEVSARTSYSAGEAIRKDTLEDSFDDLDDPEESQYRPRRSGWWNRLRMPLRARRFQHSNISDDGRDQSQTDVLLSVEARRLTKTSGCFSCGGKLLLGILSMLLLLALNATVLLATNSNVSSDPLANWGKHGTSSEGLSWYPTDFLRDVMPIACHSHNDYWRKVPLFSGLYAGCISTEADVWSFGDGELYVGHNTASLSKNRTFRSLYVDPLVTILAHQNPATQFANVTNHGVFDTDPEQSLTLLVDVKTDGATTWPLVLQHLEPLRQRGWLSHVQEGVLHPGPITVVGTGETSFNVLVRNATFRDAFFDAPLAQMWKNGKGATVALKRKQSVGGQGNSGTSADDDYDSSNSFYASGSFKEIIGTVWWGKLNDRQLRLLRGLVLGAHRRGLKVRFWEQPNWPISLRNYLWNILLNEGVDILNVDDLDGASKEPWVV